MDSSRAILILGAGRSGTSTLTRGLAALDVYLGRRFRRPVRKNPRGNYEEVHLLKLSKAIRNRLGLRADSVRGLSDADWASVELTDLRSQMRDAIEREFAGHPVWAFKYAGTGRLLPFWLDLLPDMNIQPAFAFAYRNPLSIARSRARLNRRRGRQMHNNLEWLANVVPYFDRLQAYPSVVVDYDRLVVQPQHELRRVAQQLDLPARPGTDEKIEKFAHTFVRPEWRHTAFTDEDLMSDPATHPLVRRAALQLSRLARDEFTTADPVLWEAWGDIYQEWLDLAPMLNLIDELQTELRYARWWDLPHWLRLAWNKVPIVRPR